MKTENEFKLIYLEKVKLSKEEIELKKKEYIRNYIHNIEDHNILSTQEILKRASIEFDLSRNGAYIEYVNTTLIKLDKDNETLIKSIQNSENFFKWINLDYYHFLIKKQNNSNSVIVKNKKNKNIYSAINVKDNVRFDVKNKKIFISDTLQEFIKDFDSTRISFEIEQQLLYSVGINKSITTIDKIMSSDLNETFTNIIYRDPLSTQVEKIKINSKVPYMWIIRDIKNNKLYFEEFNDDFDKYYEILPVELLRHDKLESFNNLYKAFEILYDKDQTEIIGFKELDPVSLEPQNSSEGKKIYKQNSTDLKKERILWDSQLLYTNSSGIENYTNPFMEIDRIYAEISDTPIIKNCENTSDKEKYIHEWNGLEHVTYIPFIFPAGMFIDEGHNVCKLENLPFVSKRKTFVYKNKIDGLNFYFNIRITRYNEMDELNIHPSLRDVSIDIVDGFKSESYTYLVSSELLYLMLKLNNPDLVVEI